MKKYRFYYCNFCNFGDQLNRYIFQHFIDVKIVWGPSQIASVMGIGSIIEAVFNENNKNIKTKKQPICCFSAGFASKKQIHDLSKSGELKLVRNTNFLAVRGKLTKTTLIDNKIISEDTKVVLGDGGLLASYLIKNDVQKKYRVGIVAHAHEIGDGKFIELNKKIPNSVLLDITENPILFLQHLSECETIISTAMHPLIVADSLHIPNLWIRLDETKCATDLFKFYDYYSVYDDSFEPIYVDDIGDDIYSVIKQQYKIQPQKVETIKENLRLEILSLGQELQQTNVSYLKGKCFDLLFMIFYYYPCKIFVEYPKRVFRKIKKLIA